MMDEDRLVLGLAEEHATAYEHPERKSTNRVIALTILMDTDWRVSSLKSEIISWLEDLDGIERVNVYKQEGK